MKITFLLSMLCFGVLLHLDAQCPVFEVELTTQSQVDNFMITYPGCTEVTQSVWIEGDDITSLAGLSGITSFTFLSILE